MPEVYRIKEWDDHFENSKSRERDKCSYICLPNKNGLGKRHLLRMPNGHIYFTIFILLAEACSRQKRPRQGYLTDTGRADGRPLDLEDMAELTDTTSELVESALEAVCNHKVGWIEWLGKECPPSARRVPATCLLKEGNGKEGKGKEESAAHSSSTGVDGTCSSSPSPYGDQDSQSDSPQREQPPAAVGPQPVPRRNLEEEIYQEYPRKVGKAAAMRAITRALKTVRERPGEPSDSESWTDWLLDQVKRYAISRKSACAREPRERQFTPHPATWFNEGRYDDEPSEWAAKPSNGAEDHGRNSNTDAIKIGEFKPRSTSAPERIPDPAPGSDAGGT